jgi:hypothetical protein
VSTRKTDATQPDTRTEHESEASSILDELVTAPSASAPRVTHEGPIVAECIDARHPTLVGRVRVRWSDARGATIEKWGPTLQGAAIREGDRVMLQQPSNWPEPVVTGVLDGFARRPEVPKSAAASIELKPDEVVRVAGSNGQTLLEVSQSENGPVVKLLDGDVNLELPGDLRIRANAIEMSAREGNVTIKASDDVVVEGDIVHLN